MFVFEQWGNSQIQYQASYNGPLILQRRGVTRSACQLIMTILGSLYSQGKGNSLVSLHHTFLVLLYVAVCWSSISG